MGKKGKGSKLHDMSDDDLLNQRIQEMMMARTPEEIEAQEHLELIKSSRLRKPISQLYRDTEFPQGEIMERNSTGRSYVEKFDVHKLRKAAEVHRQVRKWAQSWIKPGMKMIDITDHIEDYLAFLIEKDGLHAGQAFPTGCSLNSVAAHWTPNTGDNTVLGYDDVCKIDFGTHVEGTIIDSAFTVSFNPIFDDLKEAVKAATNAGIKEAGVDVRLCDIGAKINEVMTSYEVTINNKVYPIKPIKNLHGHTMDKYTIHAGKSVPQIDNKDDTKMKEGELYAIETFGSTGKGFVVNDDPCSHYMLIRGRENVAAKSVKDQKLLNHIKKTFGNLAFSRKWLDRTGFERHIISLNSLVQQEIIEDFPPLTDRKGCYTAQFEHSLLLRPNCVEVLSRGDDY